MLVGVAKDFEIVEPPPRVIALCDDEYADLRGYTDEDFHWGDDDDGVEWEEVYGSEGTSSPEPKESYSAVLKGKERGGVADGS